MTPSPDALLGRVFEGYQLLRILGSGGAGTVYLASNVAAHDQQVAVKLLTPPPESAPNNLAEFRARFAREAKALQILQHPHILSLLAYGEDAETGLAYMILQYMAGGALSAQLAQGALPLEDAARYGTQIADALDYAHSKGIVHRDLKPANILLDEHGEVYVADFGIAKIFDAAGTTMMTLTNTGQIIGTADYMSPEQAQADEVTTASDIYSFGMLLYHLVTGKVAFEGKSLTQILLQIATTPPIPPRRLRPNLPAPAEAAILRALAKQAADRFKTAGELASAFVMGLRDEWAPGLRQAATIEAFVPQPTITAPGEQKATRRSRPLVLTAITCLLLLVAIAGTLMITGVFPGKATQLATSGGNHVTTTLTSGKPASTLAPGQPTPTLAPGQPTPTLAPGQPTPTLAPGQPTPTLTPGQPTPSPTTHTPSWGSDWTILDTDLASSMVAATYNGQIYLIRAHSGTVDITTYNGSVESAPTTLGGGGGGLMAAATLNNRLYVFSSAAPGSGGNVLVRAFDGTSWGSDWTILDTDLASSMVAATYNGQIFLIRAHSGTVDITTYNGSTETSFTGLGGGGGGLMAAATLNTRLYVFSSATPGSGGNVLVRAFDGTSWGSDWTTLDTDLASSMVAATYNGQIFLIRARSGSVEITTYNGNAETSSTTLGGGGGGLMAAATLNNRLYVFSSAAPGSGGNVLENSYG